jgi:hypothetical protein
MDDAARAHTPDGFETSKEPARRRRYENRRMRHPEKMSLHRSRAGGRATRPACLPAGRRYEPQGDPNGKMPG